MSGTAEPPWDPFNIFLKCKGKEYIEILLFGTPTKMVLPFSFVKS